MRTWLKRMVAGIVSAGTLLGGGLLTAGTANADEIRMPDIGKTITSLTASAATTYPRELVNGGFDYLPAGGWNVISPKLNTSRGKFTSVDPVNGQYIRNAHVTDGNVAWVKWDGFDASKFGWISDQKGGKPQGFVTDHANSVELQRDNDTDNTYAEIVGSEIGKSIYQKIDTQNSTDAVYTVRFDHAALSSEHADGMQALVNGKPVTMTRIGGNKAGDKTGWTGTDIVTHATNTDHYRHDGQWATYEGKVTIPANTPVSTFTFKALNAVDPTKGNLIDNLTFKIAYRLSYDSNGGTKAKASQISSMTEGKASETDGKVKTVADDAAGSIPSNENAGAVKQAKSKTNGSVRLAADDDVAEYAANGLPDHLVNGDFEYPSMKSLQHYFTGIDRNRSQWISNGQGDDLAKWSDIPGGLDTTRFGWSSTQTQGAMSEQRANAVELQKATGETTQMGELCASQKGTAIYQDIAATPGTLYRIELDHASRYSIHLDQMQVMVGAPGHERPVEMTRTSSNKYGDKIGEKSTTIATHSTNPFGNQSSKDDFSHYVGYYTIPAGQSVTRFTFRQVSGVNTTSGNLLDNIVFTQAYKLDYDRNGGTGQVPSHTEAGKVESASVKTAGSVHAISDATDTTGSAEGKAVSGVLTGTTVDAGDGTRQRTITRSDGSVRVETIATTGAVSGCQVYYPAGAKITLATAKADSDCWDSSQISKTNRTFYGWSANTDANDKDVPVADTMDRATLDANAETQITMPARAKTVYALWAINPTLTYNVNAPAGTNAPVAPASKTVPYNTAATDTSGWVAGDAGKITGYTFQGWYTGKDGAAKYDFTAKLTSDATVYAKWTANACTVKYDAGGGQGSMPDQKFTFGVPQNLTRNTFTRSGWAFTGWKRADTGDAYQDGQQVANLICTPNGGAPFVAQWTPNAAAINYNANPPAGRTAGGQGTANWTGHTGDTQAIGANGWTVDGYTFIGWNTSADDKGTAYAPGTTWTANGTLTLYAQWTPGQAGLTYDGNGATGGKTDPQPGKTDEKINVRDNGFTRDGYMFVTWNTQAGCKGKAVDPGDEWTLQGSGTLYACWAGTAQTLAYHGNGATGGNTAVQSGKTGDELTTNANGFTRDGYTFVRWDTAKDGSGTAYGEGKNGVSQYVMKPAGNDLYAIWKANPATIQYRNDWPNTTGSTPDTTGNTGDTVTISQNSFDRPGYTFTGWSTSKRGDPSLQPGDKHTLEPRTTTVWAQWKADPAHLVYNSNIGTVGSETKTVDGVVDQTVKTITNPFDRPGYTFSGWNTQADGKGKAYATGADYVLTANDKSTPKNTSVLYAQWKINGASLKFNPNGGIGHVDDVTGDAFSTVTIPGDAKEPKITRPGYRFVGWSTEKNPPAGSTFLQPGEGKVTLPAEGSTTVYAQWEPSLTTLPFTGGQAQVPTIWLYAGFALMLIALGVMMPMLRMRMAATKRTGKHMPITGGKHAK